MSIINILTEQDANIIDLAEIKNFLRIDFDDDDNLLRELLKTAVKQCELYISKSLSEKNYKLSVYECATNTLNLPYPPVISVNSITIIDKYNNNIEYTNYLLDTISNKIIFRNLPNNFYRIDIIYTSGYTKIPDDIKQGILFHISKMYEDKVGYSPIPKASLGIYKNYKTMRI